MSSFSGAAGHVTVEDHAVIGGMSGIHQFVKIGACAMVGGMSKIVQDVCPFVIVDGNPARVVGLNSVGIARNNITPEVRSWLKKAYRTIFRSGLKLYEAIHEMEQDFPPTPEIEHLLRFLRNCDADFAEQKIKVKINIKRLSVLRKVFLLRLFYAFVIVLLPGKKQPFPFYAGGASAHG